MDNALYYTLSTVAQALSASFALLGAFVLLRLQQLAAAAASAGTLAIRPYLPNAEARRLLALGKSAELLAYLATQPETRLDQVPPHALAAARSALTHAVDQRSKVLRSLRRAMLATGAAVSSSVAGLALTPQIASTACLAYVVLALAVLALAGCLALYGFLIWQAASDA